MGDGQKLKEILDEHLTNYYQLTDEGRRDVDQFIRMQFSIKKDPERAADIKKITKMSIDEKKPPEEIPRKAYKY